MKEYQPDKAREDAFFIERFAQTVGIDPQSIDTQEIVTFYTNNPVTDARRKKLSFYNKYGKDAQTQREFDEIAEELDLLGELLTDSQPDILSYGITAENYLTGLSLHRKTNTNNEKNAHTSLFVGALTPSDIREYASCVKQVYPKANCLVTDIKGEKTPKADPRAQFFYGNGLILPLPDKSIDTLHANFLLRQLEQDRAKATKDDRKQFFLEAQRVLKTDGLLLMVEYSSYIREARSFETGLSFERFHMNEFLTRRDMERFLQFKNKEHIPVNKISGISFCIAKKTLNIPGSNP